MAVTMRRPYPAYRVNAYTPFTGEPMSEMNTTPLIDVLLVLLIMIIMTVPLASHSLEVDLPQGEGRPSNAPQISLSVTPAGQVIWDGETVSEARLEQLLARAATLDPAPVIRFRPDPQASYDDSVRLIAAVRDAGITRFAFIDNHLYREFGKGD